MTEERDISREPEGMAECLLLAEMDYRAYEAECMDYYGIKYTPTNKQYYSFLKNVKFKNVCKDA